MVLHMTAHFTKHLAETYMTFLTGTFAFSSKCVQAMNG